MIITANPEFSREIDAFSLSYAAKDLLRSASEKVRPRKTEIRGKTLEEIRFPFQEEPEGLNFIEVAEGVLWFRQPLPMALKHINIYVIDEGDGWAVIDTGYDTKKSRALWESWIDGPLRGKPITKVFMTHHHPDHIGLIGWLRERGAEVFASRTSFILSRMLLLDRQEEWPDAVVAFYKAAGMEEDVLRARLKERPFNFADCVYPIGTGFTGLQSGETLRLGGRRWRLKTGGGHAPEQVTFWSEDDPLVITADAVLPGISPNIGVYPTEPNADPLAEWFAACRMYLEMARADHLALPGHKRVFTGLPVRISQLIENHEAALMRLEEFIQTPRTAREAFDLLYRREIGPKEYGLALVEAVAHMNHLWHAQKAHRRLRDDGVWVFQARKGRA